MQAPGLDEFYTLRQRVMYAICINEVFEDV